MTSNQKDQFVHNLTIGHCNIQGGLLNAGKSTQLTQLIREHQLDILSLNELNLDESIHSSTLNIPSSFNIIRCDRPNSSRGGCGMVINKKLDYSELLVDSKLDNIEAVWIKLKSSKINVCSFYRSGNYCSVDNFIDYINYCMQKFRGKKVVWIGDINIDQNNISSSQYKKLDMTLKSYNLVQTIQGITRVARRGDQFTQSTIDVIFTNCYSEFIGSTVLADRIGDHQAIKCEIGCKVLMAPKFEKVEIRDHCQRNIEQFLQYLSYESDYTELLECENVEAVTAGLTEHIENAYYNHFPRKTITRHEKFIDKPSTELLDAISKTKLSLKKFHESKNIRDKGGCNQCGKCNRCLKCEEAWNSYKIVRNHRTKVSRFCKRTNVVNDLKMKSAKNDLKGIWKTIKLASNMNPSISHSEGLEDRDPETFNSHFATVGSHIQAQVPQLDHRVSFSDFLPPRNSDLNFHEFKEVNSDDILTYVKSLPRDKAVFDDIPLYILKEAASCVIEPLTHIVNLSLKTGIVPSICKRARVAPIHKAGDKSDPNNYRPISILPFIGKIIEYFVSQQLTEYMEDNRLFSRHQFGFRKNHSTNYLMFDLIDEIYKSKSRCFKPGIIFLDIKKAFDTVNHDILLEKLKYYGIGGIVFIWFKNFLMERYQCTKLNGNLSSFLVVLSGVPQGSILGPILFSIYINDINYACNLSTPYLFADDGALFFEDSCRKSLINMKIELLTIIKWLSANKLSFNAEKTEFMIFDSAELDHEDEIVVEFNDTSMSIKECKQTKYLGLMLDCKLNFKLHIDHIKKKVMKRIGAMYRSKGLLPIKYRKMFANALMLPQFDYLDTIYCRAGKVKLAELDLLYKKVAKVALGVPQTESSLNVYRDMKWLPLHLRRQLHLSNYMYRIINDSCPTNFKNKFSYVSGGSRSGENCNLYISNSASHKEFYYLGAKCWNNLSPDARNLPDISSFSKSYKMKLLSSAIADPNYVTNNSFEHFYSPICPTTARTIST